MSKYIKTNEFIAFSEIKHENCYYCRMWDNQHLKTFELVKIYNCHFSNGIVGDFYIIPKNFVEKEADTTIDLCDGVLIEEKDNPNKWFIMKAEEFKVTSLDKMMIRHFNFKAFIKTDKGLIYAAELNNDKGEFKLI